MRREGNAMTIAQLEEQMTPEADEVVRWRFDELVRAGYDVDDAEVLARQRDVDLHLATDLVRRGCPSGTAVRIVL
jgi:hypothetical protein